jgi:hypothetical protein
MVVGTGQLEGSCDLSGDFGSVMEAFATTTSRAVQHTTCYL